mgnify:CR=1 FL=1
MELEQLKEKLKDVWYTLNGVRKYGIVRGKLNVLCCSQGNNCVWARYSDGKTQEIGPRVLMILDASEITLTIEGVLCLEVSDKVELTTDMRLSEVKEYLTDFFKACDETKDRIAVLELENKRIVQQKLDMGQDLLEIL